MPATATSPARPEGPARILLRAATLLALFFTGAAMPAMSAVVERQKLTSTDFTLDSPLNVPDARYGESVAIAGTWMVVGSPGESAGVGKVRVYERVATLWELRTELTPPVAQAGARFGAAVDVFEAGGLLTVVVGAPLHDAAQTDQGRAYLYSDTDAAAGFSFTTTTINPASPEANGQFGAAVALYADAAAIASPNAGATDDGQVSIRGRNVGGINVWGQAAPAKSGPAGSRFGTSVDLHGEYLIVGAPLATNVSALRTGQAYVYRQDQGGPNAWGIKHTLSPSAGAQADMGFGRSVGIWDSAVGAADSTSRSMVGAPLADNGGFADVGGVVFFTDIAVTSTLLETAVAGNVGSQAGYSVALEAGEAIAGRPGHNLGGTNPDSGLVNTYSFDGAIWAANTSNLAQSVAGGGNAFGAAVDLSGLIAVAAAPGAQEDSVLLPPGAPGAGVVDTLRKPGTTWSYSDSTRAVFVLPDLAAAQKLGFAAALDGEWLAIGVQGDSQKGANAGAVYMYRNVAGTWTQHSKLTALYGAAGDTFGHSVALLGTTLIVGAPGFDGFPVSTSDSGAIYRFVFDGSVWSQTVERPSPNPVADGFFGYSLGYRGDVLVVGAVGENGNTGGAYAYRSLADLGSPLALALPGLVAGDRAGESVAVYDPAPGTPNDEVIVVGVPFANTFRGLAHVLSGPTFGTVNTLTDPAPAINRLFGLSVATFGGQVAVGAPSFTVAPSGFVHVFSGAGYGTVQTLAPSGGPGQFGYSLAMDAGSLLVGAPASAERAGLGVVFSQSGGSWIETGVLQPADLTASNEFGASAALSAGTFVMGAPLQDANTLVDSGSAYVFATAPEVLVSPTTLAVAETDSATDTFIVALNRAPATNVTVQLGYDSAQLEVDSGGGFGASPQTVTLTPANALSGVTVNVRAIDDAIAEANPHASTLITSATSSATADFNGLVVADISVDISDNDLAGTVLTQSGGSTAVTEGGAGDSYTVVLTSQPTGTVNVTVNFDAAQLVVDGETDGTRVLNFTTGNWNIAQTVTAAARNDTVVEGAPELSTITHDLTSADPDYNGLALASVPVLITDNDTAEVIFASAGFATVEGANFSPGTTLKVTANGAPGGTVAVALSGNLVLSGGTADVDDVSVITAAYLFPAGSTHDTVTMSSNVQVADDRLVEATETFTLSLVQVSGPATTTASNSYSITDNDSAAISFAATASSSDEAGSSANVPVLLTVNGTGSGPLGLGTPLSAVITTTPGSATSPADYTATDTLSFAAGALSGSTQDAAVALVNDRLVEGDETFQLGFGALTTSGSASASGLHTVTISDDDIASVGFATPTSIAPEGTTPHSLDVVLTISGSGTGTAQLPAPATVAITQTPGTAATPADYTLSTSSLAFAAGDGDGATRSIEIIVTNDAEAEADETLTLGFGAVTGPIGASGTHVVTIDDNDQPGITVVQGGGSTAVAEGGATDTYTVELDSQPTGDVTVSLDFDAAQLVVAGQTGGSHTLLFTPLNWNVAQTVLVEAVDDGVVETATQPSPIIQTVTSSDAVYAALDPADVTATITDNDSAVVSFAPAAVSASEAAGTMLSTVTLSNPVASGVSVTISSVNGTAGAADFSAVSAAPISFAPNSTTPQTLSVALLDDALDEEDEQFSLVLGGLVATGNVSLGAASATGTIVDDDAPPVLSVSSPSVPEATAGTGSVEFVVTVTPPSGKTISFTRATADGTATAADGDYVTLAPATVSIAPGEASLAIAVVVNDDAIAESTETFLLQLGNVLNASPGSLVGTATLLDDDENPTVTSILGSTPNPSEVGEPYTVNVQVRGTTASPTGSIVVDDGNGVSCGPVALVPGAAPDSTASCAISSSTAGSKTLTAVYTPSGPGFSASSATATHTVAAAPASADLVLSNATSATPVIAGSRYAVVLTAGNAGPDPAQDLQLALPLPAGVGFASVLAPGASCTTPTAGGPGTVVCTWAGATGTTDTRSFTVEIDVPAATAAGVSLSSTATVTAATADSQTGNNSLTVSRLVGVEAQLALSLGASPSTAAPGQTVTVNATVLNNGPSDAPGVSISVTLPAGLGFSSVLPSAGGSCSGATTVVCSWSASTAPGLSRSIVIATRMAAAPGSSVQVIATAASAASSTDASAVINVGTASPVVTQIPLNDPRTLLLLGVLMLTVGGAALRRAR